MDYPKSVPGVGLVDGKFVDEDQVSGTPGSLIPADWGNAVTEEILNVVREVGGEPVEAQTNQLVASIWKMFRAAAANATELLRGVLRVATQAEVNAGTLDDVAVTPKKLRFGFAFSLTPNGYIALPIWLSGLIFQWGTVSQTFAGVGTLSKTITLPVAFPTAGLGVATQVAANFNADLIAVTSAGFESKSQLRVYTKSVNSYSGEIPTTYIAVGF
ncbi:gp53-like domain-containing protein [Stutzerimonas chloritidismutans]|uniref:gp53-like domain-containing protein n=1 Tax=Stutzerimonas chloritidismutans TaxID=203192 RepID=UPI003F5CC2A0